ncbi:MAG: HEPN domain-containing protein [Candidatus Caldatribacterium sp.]|nr:HEPN domain-containing protein [Candidatus Caldatribacterium sp.]
MFDIGNILAKEGYFDKAVYHFQQAVEKSVKAILISFGEYPLGNSRKRTLSAKFSSGRFENSRSMRTGKRL